MTFSFSNAAQAGQVEEGSELKEIQSDVRLTVLRQNLSTDGSSASWIPVAEWRR